IEDLDGLRETEQSLKETKAKASDLPFRPIDITAESRKKIMTLNFNKNYLDAVLDSTREVYNKHKGEQNHLDKKGNARVVAVINDNRNELTPLASSYFEYGVTDQAYKDLGMTRLQTQEALDTANSGNPDFKVPEIDPKKPMIPMTPEEYSESRGLGLDESTYYDVDSEMKRKAKQNKKVKTKKVIKKTVHKSISVKEDGAFTKIDDPKRVSTYLLAEQVLEESLADIKDKKEYTTKLASTIVILAGNISSPFYKTNTQKLMASAGLSLTNLFQFDDRNKTVYGYQLTPQEYDEHLNELMKDFRKAPLKDLEMLYTIMLEAAKSDAAIMAVNLGGVEVPFKRVIEQAVKDVYKSAGYSTGDKARSIQAIYDTATSYQLLVEKIAGKESMLYKVLFRDLQLATREKERFLNPFRADVEEKMTTLPDGSDSQDYYGRVVFTHDDIEIKKDLHIALLGHIRDGYNTKAIVITGLS
ncbi:MAG: hypothetical protein DRQ41_12105, partial [Gammaproteobacteria bacterium]